MQLGHHAPHAFCGVLQHLCAFAPAGIVPCGIAEQKLGVTSLVDLGYPVTMEDVDVALKQAFIETFGATQ